jgi:O-antigen/teichoic acid export membrane protein
MIFDLIMWCCVIMILCVVLVATGTTLFITGQLLWLVIKTIAEVVGNIWKSYKNKL